MVEILLRLPVKSLLRFKCVCKRWLSLIVDPEFGKLHFDLDAAPTDRILNFLTDFQGISLDIEDYDSPPTVFNSPLPAHFLKASQYIRSVQIVGSCRGFILLRIITRFGLIDMVVWNPSTGIQKLINADHLLDKKHTYLCGIGYDSSNDDYVVVVVTLTRSRVEPCVLIDYFSLRNNSWCLNQRIAAPYCRLEGVLFPDGQLLNGALHWLVEVPDSSCVIIAFHVREKRLSEIPLPLIDLPVGLRYQIYHMRVMRGCLNVCLSLHGMGNGTIVFEMWTMKEYKVQSSWFKSFVCSTSGDYGFGFFRPLFFTKNGEILGLKPTIALVRFNDKGESLEYPPHSNYWTRSSLVHGVYRESLLSLPGQL